MPKRLDLTGQTFGRLTVIEDAGHRRTSGGASVCVWKCLCECGTVKTVDQWHLKRGTTRSCGCLSSELTTKRLTKHGQAQRTGRTPTYTCWRNMINRCYRPSVKSFAFYGGRGVTVCDRWNPEKGGSFENFLADMGERPKGTELDKDKLGDGMLYSPETCCWLSKQENSMHKRGIRWVEYEGVKMPVSHACKRAGIAFSTYQSRVRHGVDPSLLFKKGRLNYAA